MRLISVLISFGLVLALPTLVAAEAPVTVEPKLADGQIEVTADQSLEWYQEQRLYVARGNAKMVRGSLTVQADVLTAHERDKTDIANESQSGGGNIDRLVAEGNVRIVDVHQQVYGDRAIYDLDKKTARVTGKNLKYATDKDTVTAQDSLEYYEAQNMAVARGKAVVLHEGRHIEGDVMTAYFGKSATGQMDLSQLTAAGNVTVVTDNDVSRGDHAVYDVKKNVAKLTGHVRINRDKIQLTGDAATADFNKGYSSLITKGKGRVRALLSAGSSAPETATKVEEQ